MFQSLPLITVTLLLAACAAAGKRAVLTETEALALAVGLVNQEAERRFGIEPFHAGSGFLDATKAGWSWQALTNAKGNDVVARVRFDRDGARPEVFVDMQFSGVFPQPLKNPAPRENPPQRLPEIIRR